ncbi:hypothetical protein C1878_03300 [Gordonibacter sp. 28C]|uniref:flavodoxin domain-containing protein n=1 Tax=Gordonibacter sp. 28C TaxID=2078569 RepID=UPI000DF80BFB|nr:flavodoxin domain-containing protein [Gordonibacter sp. 28C]RDB63837.1 hypothetical protein C1878_03300 [Gordonibacter sp. 28C]
MKTLVAYSTKSGASRLCAEHLAERLPAATLADLSCDQPDPTGFDAVVVGSGVRMGKFYKPALRFLSANEQALSSTPLILFTCNAYPDTFDKALRDNVPQSLLGHARCALSLGGLPPFRKVPFSEWANTKAIDHLCAELRELEP